MTSAKTQRGRRRRATAGSAAALARERFWRSIDEAEGEADVERESAPPVQAVLRPRC